VITRPSPRKYCNVPAKSAIGDLAGIIGGPLKPSAETSTSKPRPRQARAAAPAPAPSAVDIQPRLLDDPEEQSDRITVILPISLLTQVDGRVAVLRRKKKVSVSGYIEAALRELLATGEHDIEALERYRITARRSVSKVR
jgi:hypothetical protein